jgi:hypothetical protein
MSSVPNATDSSVDVTQLAAKMTELLDQFQALVPDFTLPDPARRPRVAGRVRFGEEMVVPMIAASNNYPLLAEKNIFDADKGRLALAIRDAFRPIALRLSALTDGVNYTIDTKLAAAGTEALQAYEWSKSHQKFADANDLKPYLDEAARVVQKTLNRKPKKAVTAPTPPPAPAGQGFLASRPAPPPDEDDDPEFDAMLAAAAGEVSE